MTHRLLVDTDTLAAYLQNPDWILVDCRSDPADPAVGPAAYAAGHLPGALFLDLDRELSGRKTGSNGRHPLPEPGQLMADLGAAGIGPGRQVVVYDDKGGASAARLWWLLRWLGHDAVALLDGGMTRWQAEGRPLVTEVPARRPIRFEGRADLSMRVDADTVLAGTQNGESVLIDARVAPRFRGEVEPIDPIAGRIPGARNRPLPENLDPDGRFKSPDTLHAEFETLLAGASPASVIHYCGSGVAACHNLFAMALAGLPGARLYPGSWSEWIADPSRPIGRG